MQYPDVPNWFVEGDFFDVISCELLFLSADVLQHTFGASRMHASRLMHSTRVTFEQACCVTLGKLDFVASITLLRLLKFDC